MAMLSIILVVLTAVLYALKDASRYHDNPDNPKWNICLFLHLVTLQVILYGTFAAYGHFIKGGFL